MVLDLIQDQLTHQNLSAVEIHFRKQWWGDIWTMVEAAETRTTKLRNPAGAPKGGRKRGIMVWQLLKASNI